jgi:hypothetical protein
MIAQHKQIGFALVRAESGGGMTARCDFMNNAYLPNRRNENGNEAASVG